MDSIGANPGSRSFRLLTQGRLIVIDPRDKARSQVARAVSTKHSAQPAKQAKRVRAAAPAHVSSKDPVIGKPSVATRTAGTSNENFSAVAFLAHPGLGKTVVERPKGTCIFSQGDRADAVFFIQKGKVKVSTVSTTGKEAVIAMLVPEEFVGEECIASDRPVRLTTATALSDCVLLRISREEMVRVLGQEHTLSDVFVAFLLERNSRIQADLVDQLFNSSEKRLARVLLSLAHFGKNGPLETVIPSLTQQTLAEIVGTTRSRVSFFMNRFRKLGFVHYKPNEIRVHNSLLNVVLHE